MRNPVVLLRTITIIEGISYLLLLFIAMPLKYLWNMPGAVRVVGMAHGVLFVLFCASLLHVTIVARWPLGRSAVVFLATLIPFGAWLVDRRMKGYQAEYEAKRLSS